MGTPQPLCQLTSPSSHIPAWSYHSILTLPFDCTVPILYILLCVNIWMQQGIKFRWGSEALLEAVSEVNGLLCEWISRQRGACRSDCVHILKSDLQNSIHPWQKSACLLPLLCCCSYCLEKNHYNGQPTQTSVRFSPENSFPLASESQTGSCLLMVIM